MAAAGVPTAALAVVDAVEARAWPRSTGYPAVIKADGLAAGKGVVIAADEAQARERARGDARRAPVRRPRRSWSRSSSTARSCRCSRSATARRALPLAPARTTSGSATATTGPNTGGMGSLLAGARSRRRAASSGSARDVHQPVVDELARRGTPFHGVLYAGLMLTADGPQVLEFNVRFGDPETQAVLPRLRSDLLDLLLARDAARRAGGRRRWSGTRAARSRVVLASRGLSGDLVLAAT